MNIRLLCVLLIFLAPITPTSALANNGLSENIKERLSMGWSGENYSNVRTIEELNRIEQSGQIEKSCADIRFQLQITISKQDCEGFFRNDIKEVRDGIIKAERENIREQEEHKAQSLAKQASDTRNAATEKAKAEALVSNLRSGKVKPVNLQQAAIVFGAVDGGELGSEPKIRPDGKMYAMYGIIHKAENEPVFIARGSHGPGMDAAANLMGLNAVVTLSGGKNPGSRRFKVKIPPSMQSTYFDKAKIGGGFDLVGRYVENYSYTSLGGPVSMPVFEAVYFTLWGK